ncbi:MAG: hypothetical protein KF791_04445 [Verrucomicrobiae bacterium]|nr:hypothetical protein [Verrucomicrobiae bacterium]
MKTTFDLPENLLHRAKITAAQRKTTLKELVQQGLEYVTTHEIPDSEFRRHAHSRKLLQALQASNTEPMQPLKRDEIYDR